MHPGRAATAAGHRERWSASSPISHSALRRAPPWSYSNTGYILLGLVVETATGDRLGPELARRILEPLGLGGTSFPADLPGIPGPASRGYSLPLGPQGGTSNGPLLDVTDQNPSWAWAAGALISDLQDLTGFSRALLGGQLLPSRLLAEMLTTVAVPPSSIPLPLYDRYGLGLVVVNVGDRAPDPLIAALLQANRALGERLLASSWCRVRSNLSNSPPRGSRNSRVRATPSARLDQAEQASQDHKDRVLMAVIAVPNNEPVVVARWAFRQLLERLAEVADELRLELLRAPSDDQRDLGFAEVLADLEMRLHDVYE